MEDLKLIIAKNLADLRKKKKYTQLDLATELGYSDKAISKWEKGESLPDIEVLYQICCLYGVTLDYLTHEGPEEEKEEFVIKDAGRQKANKLVIAIMSDLVVWFLAIIAFVLQMVYQEQVIWTWFVWAVPASAVVFLVFNSIWGRKKYKYGLVSILMWAFITAVYLQFTAYLYFPWAIFFLGVPGQIAIVLWSQLHSNKE